MKFRAIERPNPNKKEDPKKFYATIVTDGEYSLDKMAEEIVGFTSLSEADVNAVLIAVQNVAQKQLAEGKIVRLGKLGSLYPTISSHGESSEELVTVKTIKSIGINYRAGSLLLKHLQDCEKHKVHTANPTSNSAVNQKSKSNTTKSKSLPVE
ncbi:MAG: HU family DNA-binding protein [Bacteroidales bacterium]